MRHTIRMGLSGAVVLVMAVTGTAAATNWGGPRDAGKSCDDIPETSQCVGENATHTIFFEASLDAELREEVVWVAANYTSVTDANLSIVTSTSGVDVKVRAVDYGPTKTWWASTACESMTGPTVFGGSETPLPGTRWCKAQIFRYNLYWRASKYPTDNNERAIACQEIGHTLGLRHATSSTGDPDWANSCMVYGNQTKITTTTHDRSHVNARY